MRPERESARRLLGERPKFGSAFSRAIGGGGGIPGSTGVNARRHALDREACASPDQRVTAQECRIQINESVARRNHDSGGACPDCGAQIAVHKYIVNLSQCPQLLEELLGVEAKMPGLGQTRSLARDESKERKMKMLIKNTVLLAWGLAALLASVPLSQAAAQELNCADYQQNDQGQWAPTRAVTLVIGGVTINLQPGVLFDKGDILNGVNASELLDEQCGH
jgi:hypothetical protein